MLRGKIPLKKKKKACKLETTVKLIKITHKVSSCSVRHRFACRVGGRRHLFVLAAGRTGKRSYKKTSYTCSGCKKFVEFLLVHTCQKMISHPAACLNSATLLHFDMFLCLWCLSFDCPAHLLFNAADQKHRDFLRTRGISPGKSVQRLCVYNQI